MIEDKFACVILNYNDVKTTLELTRRIHPYSLIGKIIIVDNNSSDDSKAVLKDVIIGKVDVLFLDHNGGYGAGNNRGIEYAKKCGYRYVIISNPDVYYSNRVLLKMLKVLKNRKIAVTAPIQCNSERRIIREFAWRLPKINEYIITSELVLNRIVQSYHYRKEEVKKKSVLMVDCVPGAFLGLDTKKFFSNYYDESFFLYCEEMVLASEVKKNGYKTALICDEKYLHKHGVSINKTVKSVWQQRRYLTKSKMLFIKKYLGASRIQMILGLLLFKISDVESCLENKLNVQFFKR